jgi:hypothetical protein
MAVVEAAKAVPCACKSGNCKACNERHWAHQGALAEFRKLVGPDEVLLLLDVAAESPPVPDALDKECEHCGTPAHQPCRDPKAELDPTTCRPDSCKCFCHVNGERQGNCCV